MFQCRLVHSKATTTQHRFFKLPLDTHLFRNYRADLGYRVKKTHHFSRLLWQTGLLHLIQKFEGFVQVHLGLYIIACSCFCICNLHRFGLAEASLPSWKWWRCGFAFAAVVAGEICHFDAKVKMIYSWIPMCPTHYS